jgi:hypothetical protein
MKEPEFSLEVPMKSPATTVMRYRTPSFPQFFLKKCRFQPGPIVCMERACPEVCTEQRLATSSSADS